MQVSEEQIVRETTATEISAAISSAKIYNPGLKALLSINKNTATLEKTYAELLQIESELDELNKNGLLIIETKTTPEEAAIWKLVLQEVIKAVTGINEILTASIEKATQKENDVNLDRWQQLTLYITALKAYSKKAADSGSAMLPEAIGPEWEMEYVNPETTLVESLVARVESSRILLQIMERYTPGELNSLDQIIANHIPADFTYEEALEYQKDYYIALLNFKQEFKNDKNLWDKFLDILAGGTHQLPSEGAMMERWLDGEESEP
jgi:hypothetical protein